MTNTWILTALGQDRPGIVAGVTKVLFELGCNLEDSAMTRLEGEFAILVIFSGPSALAPARLERAFSPLSQCLKLVVHVKRLSRPETALRRKGSLHRISVYGADRPGIVYRVSELLSRLRVNITDVTTHRTAGRARGRSVRPLYLMLLEIELPDRISPRTLEHRLQTLAKRLHVDVSLRAAEADVL